MYPLRMQYGINKKETADSKALSARTMEPAKGNGTYLSPEVSMPPDQFSSRTFGANVKIGHVDLPLDRLHVTETSSSRSHCFNRMCISNLNHRIEISVIATRHKRDIYFHHICKTFRHQWHSNRPLVFAHVFELSTCT